MTGGRSIHEPAMLGYLGSQGFDENSNIFHGIIHIFHWIIIIEDIQ